MAIHRAGGPGDSSRMPADRRRIGTLPAGGRDNYRRATRCKHVVHTVGPTAAASTARLKPWQAVTANRCDWPTSKDLSRWHFPQLLGRVIRISG